ncbi:hypothetical protein [Bradyrhizobium sp. INPA03-11B]|uniref:hypothetical protein n=1 Tax=Bradyrhizobium sp. INPA03-11B TaxID=418598 RepID=UPI00338E6E02
MERELIASRPAHIKRIQRNEQRDRAIRLHLASFGSGSRHAKASALAAELIRELATHGNTGSSDPKSVSLRNILALNGGRPIGRRQIENIATGARSKFAKISD